MLNNLDIYDKSFKSLIFENSFLYQLLKDLSQYYANAYISAGVLRNWIWSILHEQIYQFEQTEIDVIYFDEFEIDHSVHRELSTFLQDKYPFITWDITNQAKVHEWYRTEDGQSIKPLESIEEALSFWPETATAIAVRLNQNKELEIIAPFGLGDLFELKLRWNDRLVSRGVFEQRIMRKEFLQRWHKLRVIN